MMQRVHIACERIDAEKCKLGICWQRSTQQAATLYNTAVEFEPGSTESEADSPEDMPSSALSLSIILFILAWPFDRVLAVMNGMHSRGSIVQDKKDVVSFIQWANRIVLIFHQQLRNRHAVSRGRLAAAQVLAAGQSVK
ncbi:hypothetical protein AcW1_008979 [Taiwanofungus camphoratus]|nr:hypothetical protein AcW1_008979 [Antrodia cinnamomea]